MKQLPGTWKVVLKGDIGHILSEDDQLIATITNSEGSELKARLIAMSPYMFEALKNIVELIGDEDLPDNGELSGAAICDMARTAVQVVEYDN